MHHGKVTAIAVSALLVLGAVRAEAECEAAPCSGADDAGTNCATLCDGGNADANPEDPVMQPPEEDDMNCTCWWDATEGGTTALLALPLVGILVLRRRSRRR